MTRDSSEWHISPMNKPSMSSLNWLIVEEDGTTVAEVTDEETARQIVKSHNEIYYSFEQSDQAKLKRWCDFVDEGMMCNMPQSYVTNAARIVS